jgi:hypothetical protein
MEIRRGDYMPKGFKKDCAPAVSQTVVFEDVVYYRYPDSSRRSDRVYYKGWRNGIKAYLHVAIYESIRGTIPQGFEVHHKDENSLNNPFDGSNYELLPVREHRIHHAPYGIGRSGRPLLREPWESMCWECGKPIIARTKKKRFCDVNCGNAFRADYLRTCTSI